MVRIIDGFLGIIGIAIILTAVFVFVGLFNLEPCPLCGLQRLALVNIGIALLMNLRYGNWAAHWALVILSAVAGIAVSMRQILLHINDPIGFGDAIWGIHAYSWCFIAFAIAIIVSAMMLIIYPQKKEVY
ncbi:hypothetical protein BH10PSE19_BH10PSE19_13640 [soil metagenome]